MCNKIVTYVGDSIGEPFWPTPTPKAENAGADIIEKPVWML